MSSVVSNQLTLHDVHSDLIVVSRSCTSSAAQNAVSALSDDQLNASLLLQLESALRQQQALPNMNRRRDEIAKQISEGVETSRNHVNLLSKLSSDESL
jgi:hypothetical protein